MASPPIPAPLEQLTTRPFSFYPPLVNVEHNEWLLRQVTWSEFLVGNCRSGAEIWISRRYLGEVSRVDEPTIIVGLNRELELKGGMIVPFQRRVIEMPVAAAGPRLVHGAVVDNEPAPVSGIRLEPSDRKVLKLILIGVVAFIVIYLIAVSSTRIGEFRQGKAVFTGTDRAFQGLSIHDDFLAVTQKIGSPDTDHQQENGTIPFRALGYPARKYTVILMGRDKGSMTYIGTMDEHWRPVHAVNQPDEALLRGLKPF